MKSRSKRRLLNMMASAAFIGALTGSLTAVVVLLYKFCAVRVIEFSEIGYEQLRLSPVLIPGVLLVLLGIAFLYATIYQKYPNLRGGGIPTSIGILRGLITFQWLRSLIGIFCLSLTTFLIGVPLGNEGPAVQMGTAIGRGTVTCHSKKHRAWDRYAMTGGACAGFSVATGAPISGILFAIEDAHQRISPMILIMSATSVAFSATVTEFLAPLLGVSPTLFPTFSLPSLLLKQGWIPLIIGIAVGLFAVLFLKYYRLINHFFQKTLVKLPYGIRIFFVLSATLLLGLASTSFISTGHDLILSLMDGTIILPILLLLLLVRSTLTLSASSCSITGGMFLPVLAIGTLLAAILAEAFEFCGLNTEYHTLIILLGLTACIAGMMKTPLTAIVFAIEALGCYENILFVIIVSAVPYMITEIFGLKSINDTVLEKRIDKISEEAPTQLIDIYVIVQKDAFAIGKQVRDIFWPANTFVLSHRHSPDRTVEVDEYGGRSISAGDILHVRFATHNQNQTLYELAAIVGEQSFDRTDGDDT